MDQYVVGSIDSPLLRQSRASSSNDAGPKSSQDWGGAHELAASASSNQRGGGGGIGAGAEATNEDLWGLEEEKDEDEDAGGTYPETGVESPVCERVDSNTSSPRFDVRLNVMSLPSSREKERGKGLVKMTSISSGLKRAVVGRGVGHRAVTTEGVSSSFQEPIFRHDSDPDESASADMAERRSSDRSPRLSLGPMGLSHSLTLGDRRGSGGSLWQRFNPSSRQSTQGYGAAQLSRREERGGGMMWRQQSHRSRKLRVVHIAGGVSKTCEMQTPELLRKIHMQNKRATLEDTRAGSLKLRDLRQVCTNSGLVGQRPSIEVRRSCILVHLPPTRGIIVHKGIYLIDVLDHGGDGPASSLERERNHSGLQEKLENVSDMKASGPFELSALEALLIEVCGAARTRVLTLQERVVKAMAGVEVAQNSSKLLREISELRRAVDTTQDRVKGLRTAIKEVLEDEECVRRMEISRFWDHPEQWNSPPETEIAEDVEMLLECYEQEIESSLLICSRMEENLDDTLQLMELHLASIRNLFLKSELGLDVVGVVVAFVGAISGMFGMNIKSGLEEDNKGLFWRMTASMIGTCAFVGIFVFFLFRRLRL
eukprot:GHVU01065308.1.p1 GENE.GHVU01065308.1~~GHVU01065308.1.p1  ORF type:complete len:597 (-),score=101.21 GHVU01065308.1:3086-4876(-)